MEDIKTNFDKIMAQFNDSVSHAAPKKLKFDHYNDSIDSITHKRKLSLDRSDVTRSFNESNSVDVNASTTSLNSSVPSSPWEARRIKADLAESQVRTISLKRQVESLHKLRSETELLYEHKVKELTKQCEFSSNKVLDLEKHLAVIRKRENETKTDLIRAKAKLSKQKYAYEETIQNLQKSNSELEDNFRATQNRLTNELSDYQRAAEKLEMEYELVTQELGNIRSQVDGYKAKAKAYDELEMTLEQTRNECAEAHSRIKELEYEVSAYGDWKELAQASQTRLVKLPELDKKLERLQMDNKNLLNTVGNKLLLEEQVYDLKSRLENYETTKNQAITLKVQVNALEQELKEWKRIGKDYCSENTQISPYSLRSWIQDILQKDIILSSDNGSNKFEKHSFEEKILDLKQQNQSYIKNNSDLKKSQQHTKNIMLRVQKKLMLVAKERDCYKQLVENFEKDLTISNTIAEVTNPESQLRARIEMLEKTLTGYKDMCEDLEKELVKMKLLPEIPHEMTSNCDAYEHLKKEIDTLRLENERLRRRKEELELEMEHRCLKGDFNLNQFKVVHFVNNPAAEAYKNTQNEVDKLQAEIERLKRRNRKLEEDHEEMTCRLNETTDMTVNVKEMNTLRQKIESMEAKMQHMKDVYKSASMEFRDVCYMLFGYRIDRVKNTNYRITSMYAETEDEYLNFRLNESGVLDMLETDYSVSLGEMMRTHLATHKSLPTFLSALTVDLFNRTTVAVGGE